MDTIIEGKNQSFTVESEKRVLDKVATILRENDGFKQDVFDKLQQQLSETQKLYRETKEERMLFDSKLQQKISELKEWALGQMAEGYEDSAKLFDAKM